MAVEISLKKGTANPTSGLTLAEPLFNSTNNTLWMGKGSATTPIWIGAGICGASGGIAAGLTYQIPTLGAVKDYFSAVSYNFLGTTASYVSSFNGLTGAVTGVTVGGANTFTALNTFNAGISAAGGTTFSGTVASDGGYRVTSNAINAQTVSYTLVAGDNGKIVTMNSASGITLTVPSGLPAGFNATIIQLGAGSVGFTSASGVTLNSFASSLNMAGQHGAAAVISYATNIFNLSGTLTV